MSEWHAPKPRSWRRWSVWIAVGCGARQDSSGLLAVADTSSGDGLRIARADFAHAADARSGTATATFKINDSDSAYIDVFLAFADGARADVPMDLANPASAHSWRMLIGTYPPDPNAPQPVRSGR